LNKVAPKKISSILKFVYSDNNSLSVIFQDNDLLMGLVGEYNENLKEHNKPFKKILTVPNIPNRIVLFDSSILHAADGLGSIKKPRIIQTFFFENISADSFPIPELKRII